MGTRKLLTVTEISDINRMQEDFTEQLIQYADSHGLDRYHCYKMCVFSFSLVADTYDFDEYRTRVQIEKDGE